MYCDYPRKPLTLYVLGNILLCTRFGEKQCVFRTRATFSQAFKLLRIMTVAPCRTFDCIDCFVFEHVLIILTDGLVTNSSTTSQIIHLHCDGIDTERVNLSNVILSLSNEAEVQCMPFPCTTAQRQTAHIQPCRSQARPFGQSFQQDGLLIHTSSSVRLPFVILAPRIHSRPGLDKPAVAAPFTRSPQSCCW